MTYDDLLNILVIAQLFPLQHMRINQLFVYSHEVNSSF